LPNKSIKLLYANNYHDCNFNKTEQKGYTSLTLLHWFWESSTLLQLLEVDCDAAGAGARCYCWFFLEILLFEGVRWTAHGVAPGKMKCTMLLMEEDSAMLLLELVHAATPGSSNCYCWSTAGVVRVPHTQRLTHGKNRQKNSLIFSGEKAAVTVGFFGVVYCGVLPGFLA